MTDGTGTTTYTYDSLGRLVSSTDGAGGTVAYGYDLDGKSPRSPTRTGRSSAETYDPAGNLTSVTDWLGHTTTFTYDADNDLLTEKAGSSPAGHRQLHLRRRRMTSPPSPTRLGRRPCSPSPTPRTPDDLVASVSSDGQEPRGLLLRRPEPAHEGRPGLLLLRPRRRRHTAAHHQLQ